MEILQFLGQIESGFKSRAGYNGACTVLNYSKSFLQEAIDGRRSLIWDVRLGV
jgi:hypothetical protein